MINMNKTISRNSFSDEEDVAQTTFALTALGYHDDTDVGLEPISRKELFDSIETFQKDNDLKVDGIIKPDGPTREALNRKLKEDQVAGNVFSDFLNNFFDMRRANTIGADKYFHCKANYEAASRGWAGDLSATMLSNGREAYGQYVKGDPKSDENEDQAANKHGREAAKSGQYQSASEACAIFRPKSLDEKY